MPRASRSFLVLLVLAAGTVVTSCTQPKAVPRGSRADPDAGDLGASLDGTVLEPDGIPDATAAADTLASADVADMAAQAEQTDVGLDAGKDVAAAQDLTVTNDTGSTADAGADVVADALPMPTAATASATCKDKRHRGDGKVQWDHCWAPPRHYCSGVEWATAWFGCSPDQTACYDFDAGCHPCAWTPCPIVPSWGTPPKKLPKGCPKYKVYEDTSPPPPEVIPYLPNNTVFCWDGAPPEWSTESFHHNDSGPVIQW